MNRKKRLFVFLIVYLLIGLLIYSFLFGKLFPYSPIILGFEKHEFPHSIIYTQKGAKYTNYTKIDSIIPRVEQFHNLQFKKKPKMFLFGTKQAYFSHSMTRARFCACYNGNVVVSPWAQKEANEGIISMEIYLEHELSHSLLHQNAGFVRAMTYPKWLLEGIAVYSSDQMGTSWYPSKEETYTYIREGNFLPPEFFKTRKEDQIVLDVDYRITFMYSEFACIVDYLITHYGFDQFISYMKQLCHNGDHDKIFRDVFGKGFPDFINEFRDYVQVGDPVTIIKEF